MREPEYPGFLARAIERRQVPVEQYEAVLVDDSGETPMRPGDIAAFPKNDGNGHVLQNRGDAKCVFIAVGRPAETDCHYPDIDMHLVAGEGFRRKHGGAP